MSLSKARRLPLRIWSRLARRAGLALSLWLTATAAQADHQTRCTAGDGAWIEEACFVNAHGPERYGHAVLGATPEWDALAVALGPLAKICADHNAGIAVEEPSHVFEDLAPRIADLDKDGVPEVVVVQSSFRQGARLAVYGFTDGCFEQIAATPYIGTRFRWLAPLGAADLDGDGTTELAYIDRPHLAKMLRVWRYSNGTLQEVAALRGLTNHKIGEAFISGGIRDCGAGPEIITADASWSQIVATKLAGNQLQARAIAPFEGPASLERALRC